MKNLLTLVLATAALTSCAPPGGDPTPDAGVPTDPVCGNGAIEAGEACDDGNPRNGDGCDENCQIEEPPACGDGRIDLGEDCDDGNLDNGDGCDSQCNNEVQPDDDNSFETANAITESAEGVIGLPADEDFYKFTGSAAIWTYIATNANPDDDHTKIDTVISLYDANQNLIAENDDAYPRRNTDSQLIIKLPADGEYYIKVQEFSSWYSGDMEDEGSEDYSYTLSVGDLSPEQENIVEDAEGGNDTDSAQALAFVDRTVTVALGQFQAANDQDVFSFSITNADQNHFSAQLMPFGNKGYGSTAEDTVLRVTDANGATVARIAHTETRDQVSPGSLAVGDYHLWVERPAGATSGANDFYVIKYGISGDNPAETAEAANNEMAGAEALEAQSNEGGASYFVLATLAADDVDYYSFDLAAGNGITVACGSASSGSGVVGLRAEIRDSEDSVVRGADEADGDLRMRDITGLAAGTYYLRLSATGQMDDVIGNWARCGVHTGPGRN
jgi:cysteine-rich repeat protein